MKRSESASVITSSLEWRDFFRSEIKLFLCNGKRIGGEEEEAQADKSWQSNAILHTHTIIIIIINQSNLLC